MVIPANKATPAPATLFALFVLAAPAAAEVLEAEVPAVPEAAALDVVTAAGVVAAGAEAEEADDAAVPPIGAVDWPSICDWTVALNVPVMPLSENLAENARAGYRGLVESLRPIDWNRMKYSFPLGPMVGSGVKITACVVDTSTLGVIVWRSVCCCELPA